MKKKLIVSLALACAMSLGGTAFAATSIFSDVPTNHWSYDAINKLAKDGIIDGYGDGTFQGGRTISRYEMAIIVAKATTKMEKAAAEDKILISKLDAEYASELKKLDSEFNGLNEKYNSLDKRVDNVMLSGFFRAKYDSDTTNGHNTNGGNKHFYMDLEGKMKVDNNWDVHFQSETNKEYTNTTWNNDATGYNNGNDGTVQRIWTEGKVGNVGVTLGAKWWGYASCVLFGHAATGVQLDVPVTSDVTASFFDLRPTQGSLTSSALSNPPNTSLYGMDVSANLSKATTVNVVVGGNHKTGDGVDSNGNPILDTNITHWGAIDWSSKIGDNFKVTGTYVKTNADTFNNSRELRVDYKAVDLNTPGSYDIYARYVKFQKYGDISHDDEWSSLPGDMKGWVLGYDYILAKNLQWTTLYSDQKINISTTNDSRKLIRSQLDYHF